MNHNLTLKVCIAIPTINEENNLKVLIPDLRNLFPNAYIVIIDDGSTDDSVEILSLYQEQIKLIKTSNKGAAAARNLGISIAKGEFIAFLDADDVWHPQKLEIQVREMQKNGSFVMSCHERIVSTSHIFPSFDETKVSTRELSLNDFIIKNRCSTPTVMVRKSINERYQNDKRHAEDYLLWMEIIANHGNALFINSPLTSCTNSIYGGSGLSGSFKAMQKGEFDAFQILRRTGQISPFKFSAAVSWSSTKFLIRIADHYVFRGLRQTVSESK